MSGDNRLLGAGRNFAEPIAQKIVSGKPAMNMTSARVHA
jgi:hypothetical protein